MRGWRWRSQEPAAGIEEALPWPSMYEEQLGDSAAVCGVSASYSQCAKTLVLNHRKQAALLAQGWSDKSWFALVLLRRPWSCLAGDAGRPTRCR